MNENNRMALVKITGRVQGVWFRDWTKRQASALGLVGWVRNRTDHSVEALFYGAFDPVEKMIAKCRVGSPMSRVDDVVIIEEGAESLVDLASEFEIRHTS